MVLLSNCTKSSTNVLKHWTVGYFVPKKKTCFTDQLHALCFSVYSAFPTFQEMQMKYSSWIVINLLEVLVCSITEYP